MGPSAHATIKRERFVMRAATLSFLSTLLIAGTAWGQNPQDADEAARQGSEGGLTVYDFDDDNVDGELLSPDGANIASRGATKHASLIEIRPHFLRELINMARDV
jgi:hypothetical protein